MIPEMKNLVDNGHFVFQQDGARSHTAILLSDFCKIKCPNCCSQRIGPQNSSDLNPVVYGIWENLSERVYQHKIKDIQHLKILIIKNWSQMPQEQINRAID